MTKANDINAAFERRYKRTLHRLSLLHGTSDARIRVMQDISVMVDEFVVLPDLLIRQVNDDADLAKLQDHVTLNRNNMIDFLATMQEMLSNSAVEYQRKSVPGNSADALVVAP